MYVDWPLVAATLTTVGAFLIAVAAWTQRKDEELYQGLIFTGAHLIFIGFLFQIWPYEVKGQNLLIARLATMALFAAGVILAIVRYGRRRPRKSPPKSAKKPK